MFLSVHTEEEGVGLDQGFKGDLGTEAVLREGGIAGGSRRGSLRYVRMGWGWDRGSGTIRRCGARTA